MYFITVTEVLSTDPRGVILAARPGKLHEEEAGKLNSL